MGLSVREVGWLLGRSEPQVRRLLRSRALEYAVWPSSVAVESVRALFPDDGLRAVREASLDALLGGRVRVPAPARRYGTPAPITDLPYLTADPPTRPARDGNSVFDRHAENVRYIPIEHPIVQ